MELVPSDEAAGLKTPVWDEYRAIGNKAEGKEVHLCSVVNPLNKGQCPL